MMMSMLVASTDSGTTLVLPQIDATNPANVRAARYANGKRIDDLVVPLTDWPAAEADMLNGDYFESWMVPEFRVEIDRLTRQLYIAGGAPIDLPDVDPDDTNALSLVDLAEEYLDETRYYRMTDWWCDSDLDPLRATVSVEVDHGYDPDLLHLVQAPLQGAVNALRAAIRSSGEPQTEHSIRVGIVLFGDPAANGFRRQLRLARAGQSLGESLDGGLDRLDLVFVELLRKNAGTAAALAEDIRRDFACPLHDAPIEWTEPGEFRGGHS